MPPITTLSAAQIAELYGSLDDFIGTGNGVTTAFNLTYFPIVDVTLELHKATISGPLLTPTTHYTFVARTGAIKLTAAGVTFLGLAQLHAKYQKQDAIEAVLVAANAALTGSVGQVTNLQNDFTQKDLVLKQIHQDIETKAIIPIEAERVYVTGIFVTGGEVVDEAAIQSSVANYQAPLYPVPPPGDPTIPFQSSGLSGGSGGATTEATLIATEIAEINVLLTIPIVANRHLNANFTTMRTSTVPAETAAVTAMIGSPSTALTFFVAQGPLVIDADHITAGDIALAQTALTNAQAQLTQDNTWQANLNLIAGADLSNAALNARKAVLNARTPYLAQRVTEIQAYLGDPVHGVWAKRFFWISRRTRQADGTLKQALSAGSSITSMNAQASSNSTGIAAINQVLSTQ